MVCLSFPYTSVDFSCEFQCLQTLEWHPERSSIETPCPTRFYKYGTGLEGSSRPCVRHQRRLQLHFRPPSLRPRTCPMDGAICELPHPYFGHQRGTLQSFLHILAWTATAARARMPQTPAYHISKWANLCQCFERLTGNCDFRKTGQCSSDEAAWRRELHGMPLRSPADISGPRFNSNPAEEGGK